MYKMEVSEDVKEVECLTTDILLQEGKDDVFFDGNSMEFYDLFKSNCNFHHPLYDVYWKYYIQNEYNTNPDFLGDPYEDMEEMI
jgi:hypothetical protein